MHVVILLLAVLGAWGTRIYCVQAIERSRNTSGLWSERWSWAIGAIIVPAFWLMIAVLAVGTMGAHGTMFGYRVSAIGAWISGGLTLMLLMLLAKLMLRSWQIQQELHHYPSTTITTPSLNQTITIRAIASPPWFAGQVGILKPELTIGRSLLTHLDPDQLEAIIAHECAHAHYHDTTLFFILGWLRRWTRWLPRTQEIWQELILLRELRADRWAAQWVDPLLLAETLLTVARSAQASSPSSITSESSPDPIISGIGFHDFTTIESFETRIEALISAESEIVSSSPNFQDSTGYPSKDRITLTIDGWLWAILACFPLLAVPFHHF